MTARGPVAAAGFAAAGTMISAYLTWIHASGDLGLCVGVGGCAAVQSSRYATIGPVPVALVGLVGFAAMLVTAGAIARGVTATVALFALSLAATAYTAYLTYVEVFVIGAICPWCVSVALCAAAILIVSSRTLVTEPS